MNKKRVKILLIVLAALVLLFAYAMYSSRGGNGEGTASAGAGNALSKSANPTFSEKEDLLKVLMSLKSIKLDTGFFDNKVFQSLVDFSVELPPEESGRPNPFSPLGNNREE